MLIGHKPVCAFWRFSGEGEWITNTSQGGSMSYENVPMNALELAVKASKAAKAEYWACDIAIDENTDEPYILECATAFAAFPYIRDWIGQYTMWDLSGGKFRMPHVPLFSWEELGKMDPSVLRTLRHLYFAKYEPSADGAYWLADKGNFDMELTDESVESDYPESIAPKDEAKLPKEVKEAFDNSSAKASEQSGEKIPFKEVTMTQLMSLYSMEEETAVEIKRMIEEEEVESLEDLEAKDIITPEQTSIWSKFFDFITGK